MARKSDVFQFWWLPTNKKVVISEGNTISNEVKGNAKTMMTPNVSPLSAYFSNYFVEFLQYMNHTYLMNQVQKDTEDSLYKAVYSKDGIFIDEDGRFINPAIGYSYKLMANKCHACAWGNGIDKLLVLPVDLAISLPLSRFPEVIADMNKIFQLHPTPFPWFGLFFRFSTPTRGIMSLANREEYFHIEWLNILRKNQFEDAPFGMSISQSIYQLFVIKYGGRPHWGKTGLAYLNYGSISSRYDLELFQQAMQKYDPNGLFLNKFGKRLLRSGDEAYDIPSKVTRCAILNYCICKKDSDCPINYKCGNLVGYNVCY
ncbi:hypothetical protein CONCODRAFT_6736 [Conidiobolus coronatus NRRL 28638]|uniref:D-arabinono-1,4-lactone oxidase C-terminal domain-containing protein n=1 Tax=Conidiobolus coronatus (strain ATCC 28846 / CBS 209.66 / NRRL 28638) TaxID=796925 RepID=A0A137P6L5_CONC2|nr:hypothetical protein CONCODRAFT_6736 [Conidiobolus coronatus NRRL 28638]|eukprot:KXN70657.1 hypothetical protein CONCODRAFT_6736 [Conidiobolus coronatus NRRL 28638]